MKQSTLPNLQSLLESAKKGDLKAFEELILHHQGLVYHFLFHFMGNADDAADITQETFINVYRKLSQYNQSQPFTSWLMTIARNLAISHHRKHSATPIDPEILANVIKDFVAGPEVEIVTREDCQELRNALQRLPDQLREVLVMRYLLDIPLQQIAEMLGIPEGTAKSRIFKARQDLREILSRLDSKPHSGENVQNTRMNDEL